MSWIDGYELEKMRDEVARLRADLEGYMMGAAAEAREVDARGEEIKRLRADVEAYRKDAERWQHARKLLSVDDIAERQRTLEAWNLLIIEDECKRVDEAIDAAMEASA